MYFVPSNNHMDQAFEFTYNSDGHIVNSKGESLAQVINVNCTINQVFQQAKVFYDDILTKSCDKN